ncbi:hypothetical protein VSR01_16570 [Actinacidiphila sp. DG2A-62]|uniref:hypothetical protein n=1 Tax=Actinacidiphila sp. DG2A-62 TaxID=3108821 RepID=UPI002DB609A9|nr:hypothetical protein [Actinacidiphila sp. DG2A-62]MEC3995061.1 hypothetical protein [Actinacidiphila sp. DG2A-62]
MGRCLVCRRDRHLFAHRSRRDALVRALCVDCYSTASLIEEIGRVMDFTPRRDEPAAGHVGVAVLPEDGAA